MIYGHSCFISVLIVYYLLKINAETEKKDALPKNAIAKIHHFNVFTNFMPTHKC